MSGTYKKRVIKNDTSDSESEDAMPLAKRVKGEDASPASAVKEPPAATTIAASSATVTEADSAALSSGFPTTKEDQEAAAVLAKAKLSVFTTGDSDSDASEKPLKETSAATNGSSRPNGVNGKNANGSSASAHKSKLKAEQDDEVSMSVDERADADAASSSSDDDKPLAVTKAVKGRAAATARNAKASSSKQTASKAQAAKKSQRKTPAKSKKKAHADDSEVSDQEEDEDDDDDDDADSESDEEPLAQKKKKATAKKAAAPKRTPAAKVKKEESATPASSPVKKSTKGKGKAKKEGDDDAPGSGSDEEGDKVYRWWEEQNDGTTKWKTLSHNGVLFPPDYEPHGVKMKYNGKSVTLPPEAEEVASFFAALLETDHARNPTFVKNFFDSFIGILKEYPPTDGTKISEFAKCDFTPIFEHLDRLKSRKKELTAKQKKEIKAERDKLEEPYKICLLDGRKEQVGNFRVEPPGLFRGRGEHPKTGLLKTRVRPEQITINIGKGEKVPDPPPGTKWGRIVHDDSVTWLATWKENINNAVKYVFLAAGSSLKGQSDYKKFERARALKAHVDRIRADYTADLKSKEMLVRQRATAIYLIDRFALRNGNEKGDDEADTVGCCSLRFEHITLEPDNSVTFDFLGKDSIRYVNQVTVDEQVHKNLKIFKKEPKGVGDLLFDRLNTGMVNKYLTSYMDGLTAKVFRTYNASWTFVQQLKEHTPSDGSVADKILAYNRANRLVAILCNHQRSVSKNHGTVMEKMHDKTRALKYQRMKLRKALAHMTKKDKKKAYKELLEEESDIDDEWIDKHEVQLVVLEREKIRKKFDKEQLKRSEEKEEELPESELQERLQVADELEASLAAEKENDWTETRLSEDRLVAAIRKLDERIQVQKLAATDRDEGKEVSLGTSKINYLDPRITVAWAKKHDVPITRLLSKTLTTKFTWAMEVDADFDW